jgi:hypothetical protein
MAELIEDEVAVAVALPRLCLRIEELENIADRLAATCADPVAVADFLTWKENGKEIR